jgi:hypothetical protein
LRPPLIAGGAIDLPGEKEPLIFFVSGLAQGGIDEIMIHNIAWPRDPALERPGMVRTKASWISSGRAVDMPFG